jgi:hypothetical protein
MSQTPTILCTISYRATAGVYRKPRQLTQTQGGVSWRGLEAPGPGSFDPLVGVTSWLDGLAEGPHLVLGEVVLEVPEEL